MFHKGPSHPLPRMHEKLSVSLGGQASASSSTRPSVTSPWEPGCSSLLRVPHRRTPPPPATPPGIPLPLGSAFQEPWLPPRVQRGPPGPLSSLRPLLSVLCLQSTGSVLETVKATNSQVLPHSGSCLTTVFWNDPLFFPGASM